MEAANLTIKATSNPLVSVETLGVTDVASTSAVLNGKIESNRSSSISRYGFVYSTDPNTLSIESKTCEIASFNGSTTGKFNYKAENLTPTTTYYVQSFVCAGDKVYYGATVTFTSKEKEDIVTTLPVTNVSATSAVFHGEIADGYTGTIQNYGFVYSYDPSKLSLESKDCDKCTFNGNVKGAFEFKAEGLQPSNTIYVKAFAKTNDNVYYGQTVPFNTHDNTEVVETLDATDITSKSATLRGRLNSNLDGSVHRYGFIIDKEPSHLKLGEATYDKIAEIYGNDLGEFSYQVNNLSANTTYYVRAFAESYDTDPQYGIIKEFTTSSASPGEDPDDSKEYYIKHPWGTGNDADWKWKKMNKSGNGVWSYTGLWGGVGANINTSASDFGATWIPMEEMEMSDDYFSIGEKVLFEYDSSLGTLYVRPAY